MQIISNDDKILINKLDILEGEGLVKALKIKINVIWDKFYKEGEIFAEIFYRYFCSGELSVFSQNVFSIPVRCFVINDYSKRINDIKDNLTVNILLADNNMCINDRERKLVQYLGSKKGDNNLFIPIAVSKNGCDYIDKSECIVAYDGDEDGETFGGRKAMLDELKTLLNQNVRKHVLTILRRVTERIAGKYFRLYHRIDEERIGLFICHTKSTGKKELDVVHKYIATEAASDCFVDKNSILLGERLDNRILAEIKRRALIAILTDDISTKEWFRKEIKRAKECNMPVLVIDAYKSNDSRLYSYIGNCPVMRLNINQDEVALKSELDNIYEAFMNEILWTTYNMGKIAQDTDTLVLPRKIELFDIASLKKPYKRVVYPEPPLGETEREIIDQMISKLSNTIVYETEISAKTSKYKDLHPQIMISSSVNSNLKRIDGNSCSAGVNYAVREITRYLIYMGCTILNAGNYEEDGFNKVILNQMKTYSSVSKSNNAKCIHYVNSFRERVDEEKFKEFVGRYVKFVEFRRVTENADCEENALRVIRENITRDADIQIIIGGILNEEGKTGIDTELELCMQNKKSIYLLGGFGFKANELCNKYVTEENYLCLNNGLSLEENIRLAKMYDIGNILDLIFKGWSKVKSKNKR